jgi:hypothetical protein
MNTSGRAPDAWARSDAVIAGRRCPCPALAVDVAVDQNSTVVFRSPVMSAIGESGHFLARESEAATTLPAPSTATTHVEDGEAQ